MSVPYRASGIESCAEPKLPAGMHAELAGELEPGERVLYSRRGDPDRLRRRAIALLAFPIVWNGFVVMLIVLAAKHDAAIWLGAVPLLAMGIPLFAAPVAAWRAIATTFYAVTDRRVLLFDRDEVFTLPDPSHVARILR
jgi:hypothetical protein